MMKNPCHAPVQSSPRRGALVALAMAAFFWFGAPGAARAEDVPPATKEALRSSDLLYVATRRKGGDLSSIKPVWFYYEDGDTLFFTTSPGSWKAKRIRAGSPLYLWVGKKDGPFLIGEAKPVDDAELVDRMGRAYADKYWIAWLGFFKPRSRRVADGKTVAYVVTLREGEAPPREGDKRH